MTSKPLQNDTMITFLWTMPYLRGICCIGMILVFQVSVLAQNNISGYVGKYGDWMPNGKALITELELKTDGTFKLRTADPIYPQNFKTYTNEGKWVFENHHVILNPNLEKRVPEVKIIEKQIGLKDSIEIKINYYTALHENQELIEKTKTDIDILTLYFNKRRKYVHLTRGTYKKPSCAWAPRIRNRIDIGTANTFKIAKEAIKKIGVYTYGFTNFIEIDVIVPMDKERMPRSKKVIVKGNRAYFYEKNGKVKKSLNHLWKKTT